MTIYGAGAGTLPHLRVGEIDAQVRPWLELLERLGIPTAREQPTRQKWDAETFARVTGWEGRTNEHGRDAARLVFGRSRAGAPRRGVERVGHVVRLVLLDVSCYGTCLGASE